MERIGMTQKCLNAGLKETAQSVKSLPGKLQVLSSVHRIQVLRAEHGDSHLKFQFQGALDRQFLVHFGQSIQSTWHIPGQNEVLKKKKKDGWHLKCPQPSDLCTHGHEYTSAPPTYTHT